MISQLKTFYCKHNLFCMGKISGDFILWSSGEAPLLQAPNNNTLFLLFHPLVYLSSWSLLKIVQQLQGRSVKSHYQHACKITEMPKKVQRKPHVTNRKCDANTQQREAAIFFLFCWQSKITSPTDLLSIHLFSHTVYLNLGPILVTSAEVHNVVALKEQPKPLGRCVVEWEAHWP